jgi:YVTN family beta-propeller protein
MQHENGGTAQRLVGWKDISAYLKKSVRTVQRWERELGLPIHRVKTSNTGGSVFAWPAELDAWLETQSSEVLAGVDLVAASRGILTPPAVPVDAAAPSDLADISPTPSRSRSATGSVLLASIALTAGILVLASWRSASTARPVIGNEIYAATARAIFVLDDAAMTVRDSIAVPADAPFVSFGQTTMSADGKIVAAVTERRSGVALIDMPARRVMSWWPINLTRLRRARLSSDGARVIVVAKSGDARILDTATGRQIGTAQVGPEPYDAWADAETGGFIVASRDGATLTMLDGSGGLLQQIRTGDGAHDIVADDLNRRAYVTNEYEGTVACVDLKTGRVVTAQVQSHPITIALNPDGRTIYVGNRDSQSVSVIDAPTCSPRYTVAAGQRPSALVVARGGRRLLLAGDQPGLSAFELTADGPPRLLTTSPLPGQPLTLHAAPPTAVARR